MNPRVHRNETIILKIIVWGGCYIRWTPGGLFYNFLFLSVHRQILLFSRGPISVSIALILFHSIYFHQRDRYQHLLFYFHFTSFIIIWGDLHQQLCLDFILVLFQLLLPRRGYFTLSLLLSVATNYSIRPLFYSLNFNFYFYFQF